MWETKNLNRPFPGFPKGTVGVSLASPAGKALPAPQAAGGPGAGGEKRASPLKMGAPGASLLGTWETTDFNAPEADYDDHDQSPETP